jgi:glutathione S-transferase
MSRPILFGDACYVDIRSIAFALTEKGVGYGSLPKPETVPHETHDSSLGAPVLEHGGFFVRGVETALRFVDEVLPGPRLQPEAPRQRARMNAALELHRAEVKPILGAKVAGRMLAAAFTAESIDTKLPESVAALARKCVARLEEILGDGPFFAGDAVSLADIALAPVFANLMASPDADDVISAASPLRGWWARISTRESFRAIEPSRHARRDREGGGVPCL